MKVLVIGEQNKSGLKSSSLELLAVSSGCEVVGIVFGSEAEAAAKEMASQGASKVYHVKEEGFSNYHAEAYAAAVSEVIKKETPKLVMGSASSMGKDLLPKLAARFSAAFAADCTGATPKEMRFQRPQFAGKAIADIQFEETSLAFVSLRPNSFTQLQTTATSGSVETLNTGFDFSGSAIQFVKREQGSSDRPDLAEASVVVSGGRSLKTKENFEIIFNCADAFGGAAGASRAAVDEGLAPHAMQVGQTGKTVNPSVYIACGISGAIQHLAGMRTSKVIVAINKDAQAPIFGKADYGIVGDLFEVVPLLTEEAKKLLGKAA